MKIRLFIIAVILSVSGSGYSQNRTVGLFFDSTAYSFTGYTLFAPKHNTMTYLIDNEGLKVHEWTASTYAPGQSVYLLENGNLLRTCEMQIQGGLQLGGGEGGRLEEYTWNDSLIWQFNYVTDTFTQHHDVKMLPNGNIIMLVAEKKLLSEVLAAGFNPAQLDTQIYQDGYMAPDCIVEVQPTPPIGGNIVWEWHVWDHLIQDYDPSKGNYGNVSAHPELVDCAGDHRILPLFWNHMNCIDYNPGFDEIALSVRGNSEVWVIDHSTTTAQAASHSGGTHGKGGDLLYRWGNPLTYGRGTSNDQVYQEQHDVEWIQPGNPGAGDLLCFNNGLIRLYSTVDEITTPVDGNGNYTIGNGLAFGPTTLTWTYVDTPPDSMFAKDISGAQRLPNGNTLIDYGTLGKFMEVTSTGKLVWLYVNPTTDKGPLCKDDPIPHDSTHPDETMNAVFRVYRYSPDYSAFTGKDLTPGGPIECFPVGINNSEVKNSSGFILDQNVPNPADVSTIITFQLFVNSNITLTVYDMFGREISVLVDETMPPGNYQKTFDVTGLQGGIYFYTLSAGNKSETKRMTVIR
jgi:hypothetical protein